MLHPSEIFLPQVRPTQTQQISAVGQKLLWLTMGLLTESVRCQGNATNGTSGADGGADETNLKIEIGLVPATESAGNPAVYAVLTTLLVLFIVGSMAMLWKQERVIIKGNINILGVTKKPAANQSTRTSSASGTTLVTAKSLEEMKQAQQQPDVVQREAELISKGLMSPGRKPYIFSPKAEGNVSMYGVKSGSGAPIAPPTAAKPLSPQPPGANASTEELPKSPWKVARSRFPISPSKLKRPSFSKESEKDDEDANKAALESAAELLATKVKPNEAGYWDQETPDGLAPLGAWHFM